MSEVERNEVLDAVRGIAIILVMVGHVIEVNVTHFFDSTIFNIIWSLQMPLFMIISGYVTKYSKTIKDKKSYYQYLIKRTIAYILPWVAWTILVNGAILGKTNLISYIKYIIFTMDAGYWFLFTLWTICLVFGTSTFIANKLSEKKKYRILINILIMIIFSIILLIIGIKVGISFLGIKLTLYYIPFFYLGYIFANVQKDSKGISWFEIARQAVILPSIIIYITIILNFNLYSANDTLINIVIRIVTSVLGCMIVFYTISNNIEKINLKIKKILLLSGKYSLELYMVHVLLKSIITVSPKPEFLSINGFILCLINFVFMILFSIIIILVISTNKWSRYFMFGKK